MWAFIVLVIWNLVLFPVHAAFFMASIMSFANSSWANHPAGLLAIGLITFVIHSIPSVLGYLVIHNWFQMSGAGTAFLIIEVLLLIPVLGLVFS